MSRGPLPSSKKKKKKGDNTLDEEEILSRPGRLLVDATDSVILMAFALDPMHLTLERSNSRQVLVPSLVAETTDPSWRFNLFQTPSPLKFSQATGRSADWKPPHLLTWSSWLEGRENNDSQESNGQDSGAQEVLARAPFASWTGIIDRVELVSILKRCVNCHGQQLVEREIEYAVKMFESLEQSMQREQWDSSFRCAVDLVWRFPNFALAYFKAGLCLALRMRNRQTTKRHRAQDTNGNASSANSSAAENGAAGTRNAQGGTNLSVSDRMHASFEHAYGNVSNLVKSLDPTRSAQADGTAAGAMDDDGVEAEMLKRSKDDYSLSPLVLEEIAHFWRCASLIEPHNSHLNGLIDLALRLSTGVFVSRIHMYRDPGLFPRSLGDAVALALLEQAPTRN
ncbi:Hypothetical Protein FCC1311_046372 [Hondaea fermentalgiana]|uniref:Uncharacterized protein n=1 Tax=Hondaea fermentalgiana TaxID=2315210 RepID=A0A2R5GKL5_9STRA|nr:Hypothetical Protein FCC1311_046372 [Hondaea fermentalgiana]|eukprot:GBG28414.1 Hypothetical Protein FCC1311_046372 [Hondaea fermentalgiana]